jgi:hypothetical protein
MFSSQKVRTVGAALSIAVSGAISACSDTSSPALRRASDAPSSVVAGDTTSGLVAAYGFNEASGSTVGDVSAFANNGTFGSGVSRTTSGKFGGALQFNGSGKVTIPSTASLRLTNAMTLEAWVNPSAVDASWRNVVYKGDDNYYLMATSSSGGRPAGGASFGNTSATTEAYGTSTLSPNTWSHLAVTYDGSIIRLYGNGTQVAMRSKLGTYTTSDNPLQVGGNTFYNQFFRGKIDEVRVYNRALGAAEIQGDMNTAIGDGAPADTAAPVVTIAAPTTDTVYTTTATAVAMSGTASDDMGVMSVHWSNDRGGSGMASGTSNWSVHSVPLQPGANVVTVTARDAANNLATTTLTAVRDSSAPTTATRLVVTTQPSASAPSGVVFARQPVIQLRDANGRAVAQSGVAVVAAIASGGGTLGGATTVATDANGAAVFANLSIGGRAGSRVLNFTAGSLTPTASSGINITAGPAAKLVVASIGSQTANAPFNVTVRLTDAYGNPASNAGASGVVTLSRQSGNGIVGGTTTGNMAVGSTAVTISGVTYSRGESGVSLLATGGGAGSSVSGKTGVSNVFTVAAPAGDTTGVHSYTTNFPGVESPISEGGRWINGGTNGIDWTDVWSLGGKAIGREVGRTYTDGTALLTGTWGANQQATATVFSSGTVSGDCYPEVELRLRSAIAPHSIRGYEVGFKVTSASDAYLIIVRWNGPYGDFTYLLNAHAAQYGVKDGDVVSAKIVGNVITAYKNGVVMGTATDNTYTTGSPGVGFNLENAASGCSGSNDQYGFSRFTATDGAR